MQRTNCACVYRIRCYDTSGRKLCRGCVSTNYLAARSYTIGADLSLGTDAWMTFCIAYRDDNNRPHGTGFILYFERDNPAIFFPDNGIVSGKLKMYPFVTSEF